MSVIERVTVRVNEVSMELTLDAVDLRRSDTRGVPRMMLHERACPRPVTQLLYFSFWDVHPTHTLISDLVKPPNMPMCTFGIVHVCIYSNMQASHVL